MKSLDEQLFIWKVNGQPDVGMLRGYAKLWEHNYYSNGIRLSETVMTWDDDEDAVTYKVRRQCLGTVEDSRIRFEFSVTGFEGVAVVLIDGLA